ncbi:PPOX class F420-dependent oxidoreductase [Rhodococcus sp. B50]|uniref:PPOX class F420-dependent oxidoreductase n=1 Tax=Rhodococcus sp. B50 TaxID=2682847 RepID=UPI001BD434DE|nr:PPOX class F420-dependent oxidoreductase [Rhodococcus sp. B50]MBS9376300.1 F420H(2)-dependent reductase [Rhodococcus sp. B50]
MTTIPEGIHDILTSRSVGFLATCATDGRVSVTPVSPMFDGTQLRFSTTTDRAKYRNLQRDSRATFCMTDPADPVRYVEVRGTAVIEPDDDRSFIDSLARHHMGMDRYPYDAPGARRVVITLKPEKVSAPTVAGIVEPQLTAVLFDGGSFPEPSKHHLSLLADPRKNSTDVHHILRKS